jgi:hypothetical protein
MFAVVQFPIADARRFVPDRKLRHGKPSFPKPRTHSEAEFIKCFGPATDRKRDPDPEYADEQYFCRANRAILFANLHSQRIMVGSQRIPVSCRFRRLFSDGKVVSRLEIGFSSSGKPSPLVALTGEQCVDLVTGLMSLQTRVRTLESPGPWESRDDYFVPRNPASLISIGKRFARLYAGATTNPKLTAAERADQSDFVIDAPPLVIVEFNDHEIDSLPAEARLVDPALVNGAHIGFVHITLSGTKFGAWFVQRRGASDDALRRLRLCILRLNAERQVLDQNINLYNQDLVSYVPRTEAGDELEAYISKSLSLIKRPERHQINQSAILTAFDAAGFALPPADLAGLAERYEGMRRQVKEGFIRYQENRQISTTSIGQIILEEVHVTDRSVTITNGTGNVVSTGEGEVNATITINQTAVNDIDVDELRKSLDELYEALGSSNLPGEVKQEAQAATFQAKKEGIKDGKVNGTNLATNLEVVGKTLEQANTVVEEGSTLWNSIKKVSKVVGPIVVGGLKLAALVI